MAPEVAPLPARARAAIADRFLQEALAALGLGAKAKSAQSNTDAMGDRFLTQIGRAHV